MVGARDRRTGLWCLPLTSKHAHQARSGIPKQYQCNNAHLIVNTAELIKFLHAATYSPTTETWCKAVDKGYFQSWPGLTAKAIRKYLPKSEATIRGHMDQTRQNVRSTKPTPAKDNPDPTNVPEQEPGNPTTNVMFAAVERVGKVYTDQTGRFPVISTDGYKYVLVMYVYDANAVLAEPLKNRTGGEITTAYKYLVEYLTIRGYKPQVHWLDNEASASLKNYDKTLKIDYQLVPPHMHRRNAAERGIRTWKNHFVAGLSSTDSKFPLSLWSKLIEQANITLNLLQLC